MTVCMAALSSDDGDNASRAVVVAADRMVTMGGLIEFEHTAPKSAHIGTRAVALIAGDALIGSHVAREVAAEIAATPMTVAQLAGQLSAKYTETRNRNAEADILVPRGLTWATLYANHQQLVPQIVMMLDNQLSQYNLGVELLLAGVDDGGGHISTITNPGSRALDNDAIGYGAIGSGALHAIQSMIGFRHSVSCPLNETIFRVYASKRRAEVAPGVGKETDLFIVRDSGVTTVGPDTITELAALYAAFEQSTDNTLQERLKKLPGTSTEAEESK